MQPWLLGKLASPFLAVLLVWLVTAPIRRWIERTMPEGRFKRFLLTDRDAHPWVHVLWLFILYVLLAAFILAYMRFLSR